MRGDTVPPGPEARLEDSIRADDHAAATDLLRSGADAGRRGPGGMTPLMAAAGLGQAQMCGPSAHRRGGRACGRAAHGAAALHKGAQSGNADVIGLFLDHGAFIDQQSPVLGNTPLMDAVQAQGTIRNSAMTVREYGVRTTRPSVASR